MKTQTKTNNQTIKKYCSYNKIENAVESIKEDFKDFSWSPDLIVGINRGGLIPAVILSHKTDTPMISINWSTRDYTYAEMDSKLTKSIKEGKKILILDDICDTGRTFRTLCDDLESRIDAEISWHDKVRFGSIFYKASCSFQLSFSYTYAKENEWIVFPWET